MRLAAFGLLTVCLLAGSTFAQDDAAKKDMKLLEGTWTVESATKDGKDFDRIKNDKLVFAGNKLTVKMKDRDENATYTIDPSKKPKTIDISTEGKMERVEGIYEVKGDSLKICFGEPGTQRPDAFSAGDGTNRFLVVLKREKQ
jgi:uncharacterized protein (TIGR03067 family)